ncbi:MAG: sulfotransferase family protein [Opitutales bacterium]
MQNPIIILGAPRSGTTILGEILSAHPDLHYLVEPNPLWRRYVRSRCDYFNLEQEWDAVEPTKGLFESEMRKSLKMRLLEKTPQNCLRVPFVDAVFPDAKFVHILRDGVESSLSIARYWQKHTHGFRGVRLRQRLREASLQQLPRYGIQAFKRLLPAGTKPRVFWGPVLPGMGQMVDCMSITEVAAMQWRMCVEQATFHGRKLPPNQYLELRIEEFNKEKLKQVIEFVGLSSESSVFEAAEERFIRDQTAHRIAEADEKEVELVKRWVLPTMKWLGQL